jgi:glycosyltransferase involved in cell wall biosynthesis
MAERLRQLLRDDLLRRRLGRQAAEYAKRYAWPLMAEQIIDLYQGVLGVHA